MKLTNSLNLKRIIQKKTQTIDGRFFIFLQPRNKEQEAEVLKWVFDVLGEKVPSGQYEDILRDGQVLCKLANKLTPGSVKKIQERGTNFQLMENVQRYENIRM